VFFYTELSADKSLQPTSVSSCGWWCRRPPWQCRSQQCDS